MARTFRYGGGHRGPPRRVAYRMVNGKKFYERSPRDFPYGAFLMLNLFTGWQDIAKMTLVRRS